MKQFFLSLLAWLPFPFNVVCTIVVTLFFLFTLLHLIRFILDLIPFL